MNMYIAYCLLPLVCTLPNVRCLGMCLAKYTKISNMSTTSGHRFGRQPGPDESSERKSTICFMELSSAFPFDVFENQHHHQIWLKNVFVKNRMSKYRLFLRKQSACGKPEMW